MLSKVKLLEFQKADYIKEIKELKDTIVWYEKALRTTQDMSDFWEAKLDKIQAEDDRKEREQREVTR